MASLGLPDIAVPWSKMTPRFDILLDLSEGWTTGDIAGRLLTRYKYWILFLYM